jgi:hypothetical protein
MIPKDNFNFNGEPESTSTTQTPTHTLESKTLNDLFNTVSITHKPVNIPDNGNRLAEKFNNLQQSFSNNEMRMDSPEKKAGSETKRLADYQNQATEKRFHQKRLGLELKKAGRRVDKRMDRFNPDYRYSNRAEPYVNSSKEERLENLFYRMHQQRFEKERIAKENSLAVKIAKSETSRAFGKLKTCAMELFPR